MKANKVTVFKNFCRDGDSVIISKVILTTNKYTKNNDIYINVSSIHKRVDSKIPSPVKFTMIRQTSVRKF